MKVEAGSQVHTERSEHDDKKTPLGKRVQREVVAWTWVAIAFLLINGTLGQARVIPSGSMERTLLVGDHLIMSRLGYDAGVPFTNWHLPLWRSPQRQQVVIFRPPFDTNSPDYVKRIIGLPGETLEIRAGAVWINGKKLNEPYLDEPMDPSEHDGPYQVPADSYFVMGDNRQNSLDSRAWGFVPRANIIGTPVIIYMSIDAPRDAWEPGQIRERVLAYINAAVHPHLVRWKRLFSTF